MNQENDRKQKSVYASQELNDYGLDASPDQQRMPDPSKAFFASSSLAPQV